MRRRQGTSAVGPERSVRAAQSASALPPKSDVDLFCYREGKGEPRFEEALLQAQERAPQSIAVKIGFDDAEARKIFAGSDFTFVFRLAILTP